MSALHGTAHFCRPFFFPLIDTNVMRDPVASPASDETAYKFVLNTYRMQRESNGSIVKWTDDGTLSEQDFRSTRRRSSPVRRARRYRAVAPEQPLVKVTNEFLASWSEPDLPILLQNEKSILVIEATQEDNGYRITKSKELPSDTRFYLRTYEHLLLELQSIPGGYNIVKWNDPTTISSVSHNAYHIPCYTSTNGSQYEDIAWSMKPDGSLHARTTDLQKGRVIRRGLHSYICTSPNMVLPLDVQEKYEDSLIYTERIHSNLFDNVTLRYFRYTQTRIVVESVSLTMHVLPRNPVFLLKQLLLGPQKYQDVTEEYVGFLDNMANGLPGIEREPASGRISCVNSENIYLMVLQRPRSQPLVARTGRPPIARTKSGVNHIPSGSQVSRPSISKSFKTRTPLMSLSI